MAINRRNTYSILIVTFAFIFSISFPFSLFIDNSDVCLALGIVLRLAFIIFTYFYIKKEDLPGPKTNKLTLYTLLFIPFLALCGSNLIYALIENLSINTPIAYIDLLVNCIFTLISVIAEEIVFRVLICAYFEEFKGKLFAILMSSLCFGAMHLLNINSLASIPYCLAQLGYTFFLGLILALAYVYTKNIFVPIVIHGLFNILNNEVSVFLFDVEWNKMFYIVNISIGIILALYGVLIYIFVLRKGDNNYVS